MYRPKGHFLRAGNQITIISPLTLRLAYFCFTTFCSLHLLFLFICLPACCLCLLQQNKSPHEDRILVSYSLFAIRLPRNVPARVGTPYFVTWRGAWMNLYCLKTSRNKNSSRNKSSEPQVGTF